MWSADHHGHVAAAKLPREIIGVEGGRRGRRDPNEVDRDVEPHRVDDLVGMRDVMLTGGERRDQWHGELRELDQAPATKSSRRWRLRGDQVDAHACL